jgi:hypothetical protein
VEERDAEPRARRPQDLAGVRRPVVKVEEVGRAVLAERLDEELQHVGLPLGVARLDGEEESARVVEERVDAERPRLTADEERGSVTHVGMP